MVDKIQMESDANGALSIATGHYTRAPKDTLAYMKVRCSHHMGNYSKAQCASRCEQKGCNLFAVDGNGCMLCQSGNDDGAGQPTTPPYTVMYLPGKKLEIDSLYYSRLFKMKLYIHLKA